jgi:hypothetical protein
MPVLPEFQPCYAMVINLSWNIHFKIKLNFFYPEHTKSKLVFPMLNFKIINYMLKIQKIINL